MLIINNKALKVGNKWLNPVESPAPTPPGPTFDEVTIGTQTWMASNLAIDDGGEGIVHFDNVTANGVNYGTQYYYTWEAAQRVADSIDGWHVPTEDEFNTLLSYVGSDSGIKLKSTSGWNHYGNGTDDYGFNALPVGFGYVADPYHPDTELIQIGEYSKLQSCSQFDPLATVLLMNDEYNNAIISTAYMSSKLSVRLIKDT